MDLSESFAKYSQKIEDNQYLSSMIKSLVARINYGLHLEQYRYYNFQSYLDIFPTLIGEKDMIAAIINKLFDVTVKSDKALHAFFYIFVNLPFHSSCPVLEENDQQLEEAVARIEDEEIRYTMERTLKALKKSREFWIGFRHMKLLEIREPTPSLKDIFQEKEEIKELDEKIIMKNEELWKLQKLLGDIDELAEKIHFKIEELGKLQVKKEELLG